MLRHLIAATALSVAMLPAAQVPRQAADLVFTTPQGQKLNLSQFKGKVVVVEVLRTTCTHCQNSSRILARLNAQYGSKGFQPLGVSFDPGADLVSFTRAYGVNFPIGAASQGDVMGFLQHSMMTPNFYFPQMVFIDRKGVVRAQFSGNDPFFGSKEEANVREWIEKLLAEGAPAKAPAPKPAKKKKAS